MFTNYDYAEQYKYLEKCAAEKGFTTAASLAEKAEVDPAFLSRYKNGQIKNPSLLPFVRVYSVAEASLDMAFGLCTEEGDLKSENQELKHKIELLELELKAKDEKITAQTQAIRAERRVRIVYIVCLLLLILAIVFITTYDKINPYVGWFRF